MLESALGRRAWLGSRRRRSVGGSVVLTNVPQDRVLLMQKRGHWALPGCSVDGTSHPERLVRALLAELIDQCVDVDLVDVVVDSRRCHLDLLFVGVGDDRRAAAPVSDQVAWFARSHLDDLQLSASTRASLMVPRIVPYLPI